MLKLLKNLKRLKGTTVAALIFVVLNRIVALALPMLMSLIINNGISTANLDYIKQIGFYMTIVSLLNVFVAVLASYFSAKTSMNFGAIIRENIFLKVESLSRCDIDTIGTSSLITRSTSDINVLRDFVLRCLKIIISAPIMLVGGSVMAVFLNAKLTLVVFAVVPVIAILAFVIYKTVVPLFRKRRKMTDEVTRFLRRKLSGIRVIRAFNTTDYEDDRFNEKNNRLSSFILKFSRIMALLIPIAIVLVVVGLDGLILVAAKSIDTMTDVVKIQNFVGDLRAFVVYMIMVVAAISVAAAMFVIVPRANISAKRILEVMSIEPKIVDPETEILPLESKKGEIEFKNVSFSYNKNSSHKNLSNINFVAESGKTTAIIGATGSGKSTLLNLINRFYDVDEGEILFEGVDVRSMKQKTLHSHISLCSRKVTLFSGSIKDNLLYGDENATQEKLEKAIEISQSKEFIDSLPQGIDSFVTQNATNYSGGQKQRLSIARALCKDADVYVFDDSFSALDFKTDAKLRLALKKNINATVLIVARRVGTIMDADKIIVLDKGKIVGQGKHKELFENCETYREIALSQLSKEEVANHG